LPLGQALHLLPPSTPPGGDGGTRDQRLSYASGDRRQGERPTQNQALSALLFLYRHVLAREIGDLGEVIRARKPKRLPVVMTREEAKAVLGHLRGDKWLMASLMYGAGLRLMECLCLRVQDMDFTRSEITVRGGKGAKDRITMLRESLKAPLRDHLEIVAMLRHEQTEVWRPTNG
jgi:site-specific recombinase XerD